MMLSPIFTHLSSHDFPLMILYNYIYIHKSNVLHIKLLNPSKSQLWWSVTTWDKTSSVLQNRARNIPSRNLATCFKSIADLGMCQTLPTSDLCLSHSCFPRVSDHVSPFLFTLWHLPPLLLLRLSDQLAHLDSLQKRECDLTLTLNIHTFHKSSLLWCALLADASCDHLFGLGQVESVSHYLHLLEYGQALLRLRDLYRVHLL